MPTYAIGDIHGCRRTFVALLDQLRLQDGGRLILLGDYIDRGPDSGGVLDTIFDLRARGHEVVCLRGNHEQLMLDAFRSTPDRERWLINGGDAALDSFGARHLRDIPVKYLDFAESTLFWYETDGYLCLHGGPDFARPDPLADRDAVLRKRWWYKDINYDWLGKRTVLHGHTPIDVADIHMQHQRLEQQQYLNLDNGCVYALLGRSRDSLGRLAAFCLETRALYWQACID